MIKQDLVKLGLSKEESDVYLAVLELGGTYASSIARKAKISRVNCYYVLEKLKKRGLVSSYLKDNVKIFAAEPPQVLVSQLEEKYKKAKKLLPELLSVTNSLSFKPKIRSYEGIEGIKNIFEQTLEAKSEVLGYTNLEALGQLLPDYLPSYVKKILEGNIKTRLLSPSTEKSRAFIQDFFPSNYPEELFEILFVNPSEFNFENQIAIYDNSVAIISLNPEESIGVLIESAVYARTQRAVFNLSWLGATSFIAV